MFNFDKKLDELVHKEFIHNNTIFYIGPSKIIDKKVITYQAEIDDITTEEDGIEIIKTKKICEFPSRGECMKFCENYSE